MHILAPLRHTEVLQLYLSFFRGREFPSGVIYDCTLRANSRTLKVVCCVSLLSDSLLLHNMYGG